MYDIAVILINYNSGNLTIDCVKSIIEKTASTINYQIVIVDNCSKLEDFSTLETNIKNIGFKNLTLVRSRLNTGFGTGNMLGVHYSNAKYLAFVNNDTIFKNDCLSILKKTLDTNPAIGIGGAQAYNANDGFMVSLDHFASPAREILGRSILESVNPKRYPKRKRAYQKPVAVNFIPGSFMFVRADDFNAVGGFDTNIFLYYEETDLCKKLLTINKPAFLIPEAEFIHYHGASTESSIGIKKELKISLMYIMRKHYGLAGYLCVLLFMQIKYFFSSIVKPKNWPLFFLLLKGAPLSDSLKQKQKISAV